MERSDTSADSVLENDGADIPSLDLTPGAIQVSRSQDLQSSTSSGDLPMSGRQPAPLYRRRRFQCPKRLTQQATSPSESSTAFHTSAASIAWINCLQLLRNSQSG